jgi:hypothetical protein
MRFTTEELLLILNLLNESKEDVSVLKEKIHQQISLLTSYEVECG